MFDIASPNTEANREYFNHPERLGQDTAEEQTRLLREIVFHLRIITGENPTESETEVK